MSPWSPPSTWTTPTGSAGRTRRSPPGRPGTTSKARPPAPPRSRAAPPRRRREVVRRPPTVVLDAAHNRAGARATAEAVGEAFDFSRLIGVVGASGDKNVRGLLEAFEPIFAEVVITQNSSHRAMDSDEL